jgi:lipopolysaccharide transport system ATP-binding protein
LPCWALPGFRRPAKDLQMFSEHTTPDSTEYAIEVNALSKCYQIYDKPSDRLKQMLMRGRKQYYKEFWALKDVSFKIKKGETVGIIGRNGSGKSTLLQMICGTLNPTGGEVKVNGRVAALLELGAGFNPEFSGVENVYMAASLYGLSKEEVDQRFDAIAAFADIGDHIHQPVKTYSSGMFARLAFSVVAHVEPDVLVVDEALAVGDARFVAKSMKKIKKLQNSGSTIIFVSHDVGSVRTLCQQAIWLHAGHLMDLGEVFPVTGKFTEYIFKDPDLDDTAEDKIKAVENQLANNIISNKDDIDFNEKIISNSIKFMPIRNPRHLAHWGSHQGLILSSNLTNSENQEQDVFNFSESFKIYVKVKVPKTIPRNTLGVAISIKDLKGTDLIVSSTYDSQVRILPEGENFQVVFSMINILAEGEYLLVVALESREHNSIHYYEYIEGIQYFKTLSNRKIFGIFQPQIDQQVLAHP